MLFLYFLPALLSILVMGAHFLRAGALPLVLIALLPLVFLAVRRVWAQRVLQTYLVLIALQWIPIALGIAQRRQLENRPATRAMIIFLGVGAFALLAAWLLGRGRARRWFRRES